VYTLYYAPRSAAMGVRVLLEAIGAPYALSQVDIYSDEPRDAEFLRINPNGWVPALSYDGGAMYEAAAITIFLCDRHPEAGLAPLPDDLLRGKFLQWLVYMVGTRLAEIWQNSRRCLEPGPMASREPLQRLRYLPAHAFHLAFGRAHCNLGVSERRTLRRDGGRQTGRRPRI
jgi:glutathione S-transferase